MIPTFRIPDGQDVLLHLLSTTALLAVVAMADAVLRRFGRHGVRAMLATAAVLKLAAGPWLCFSAADGPAPTIVVATTALLAEGPRPETAPAAFPWFWIWLGGAVVSGAVSVRRTRQMQRRLEASARPADAAVRHCAELLAARLGLARPPAVRQTDDPAAPCVLGVRRPIVYLPTQNGPAAIPFEHALLHELVHVRRRDLPLGLALRVLAVAYWFHPLVWVFCRRITELREIGCDAAAALAAEDGPIAYRDALLRSAAVRFGLVRPAAVAGWIGPSSGILVRLRQLNRALDRSDRSDRRGRALPGSAAQRRMLATLATGILVFASTPVFVVSTAPKSAATPTASPTVGLAAGSTAGSSATSSPTTSPPATATTADSPAAAEVDALAAARGIWERQAAGERESCLRVRFAAIQLAAAASNKEADTAAATLENRR